MTSRKVPEPHTTKEGLQRFLEYWLYGLLKTSSDLGTTGLLLRKVEEEAVSRFLDEAHVDLGHARDPERVIRNYLHALDERGVMDERDVVVRAEGDRVRLEIGALCPYRTVCAWANSEQRLHRCFRAIAFAEILRRRTDRTYEGTLDTFGLPCKVTLAPSRLEVR